MLPFTDTIDEALLDMCHRAKSVNEENLRQILADNSQTAFGREHSFSSTGSTDEYRKNVPLAGYEYFSPAIEKMMSGGKELLTSYPVVTFCRTSGTTGNSKYIPLSAAALERYSDYFECYKNRLF